MIKFWEKRSTVNICAILAAALECPLYLHFDMNYTCNYAMITGVVVQHHSICIVKLIEY